MAGVLFALALFLLTQIPVISRQVRRLPDTFLPLGPHGPVTPMHPAMERLAASLHRQLGRGPYQVLTAPEGVRVEWNTGLVQYRSLLNHHQHQSLYRSTLFLDGDALVRNDEEQRWDASAGLLRVTGSGSMFSGRKFQVTRRKTFVTTPQGMRSVLDYSFDSRVIGRAIKQALAETGLRQRESVKTRMSIVAAVAGLVIALLAGVYGVLSGPA